MTNFDKNFMSVEKFLKSAIKLEVDAARFYREMQDKTNNEDVREVLRILEKEEIKHQRILREFNIEGDKNSILQFAPSFSMSLPTMTSEKPGVDEILNVAIARERKKVNIYEHTSDMVTGAFQELLINLAGFERQHEEMLLRLQAIF
jgi:rubrerythrin